MAARGFNYNPPFEMPSDRGSIDVNSIYDLDVISRDGIGLPTFSQPLTPSSPLPADEQDAYNTAAQTCETSAESNFANLQPIEAPLMALFAQATSTVQISQQVTDAWAEWKACVAKGGLAATDANAFLANVTGQVTPLIENGQLSQARSIDAPLVKLFTSCTRPVYSILIPKLDAARNEFLATHAEQITQLGALIDRDVAAATEATGLVYGRPSE